jgi:hypothetical protein
MTSCRNVSRLIAGIAGSILAINLSTIMVSAQQKTTETGQPPASIPENPPAAQSGESRRIFGIIPNYRTSPSLINYEPLSVLQKYKIATEDAFDRGTFVLAAAFAGEGQLTNSNRAFGQGSAGYAQYLGTSFGDFVIGDYMTEAVFPSLLHQDPRYFRRGEGSVRSRFGYACGQIFWTHNDSGTTGFNYSEIIGNSTAVAISQTYYVDNRTWQDATTKFASQLGVDMAANVLKEFWPDIERKLFRRHAR